MKNVQNNCLAPLVTLLLVLASQSVFSQEYSVGINTDIPNPNAVLHLVSPTNDQGLLVPRLTTSQRIAMTATLGDITANEENTGLLVYDEEEGAFYYWLNPRWAKLMNTKSDGSVDVEGTVTIHGAFVTPSDPAFIHDSDIDGAVIIPNRRLIKVEDGATDGIANITAVDISSAVDGQEVILVNVGTNPVEVISGASVQLNLNTNYSMPSGGLLHLIYVDELGQWLELSRSQP